MNITKLCTSKTRDWKRKGKIETERDTLGIPGREVFQTVANQERGGDAEIREEQSRTTL